MQKSLARVANAAPRTRRHLLRAALLTGAGALLGGAPAAAEPPPERTADFLAVPGEGAETTRLRRALADAARGIPGPWGRDRRGRIVVKAAPVTHVLKDTLVVGGGTHLDASAATFTADFPVVPYTYHRDPDPAHRHSPWPTYPEWFTSVAAHGVQHPTMLINAVPAGTRGYGAPGGILVGGGRWNPVAHFLRTVPPGPELDRATAAPPINALTFQHTEDIEVVGVTITDVKWWHAIEFNAVRGATVHGCLLSGWVEAPTVGLWHGEAVQLDTATQATTWAGVADNTPSSGIRVLANRCGPSAARPSWGTLLGSHTFADGVTHSGVRIEGNAVRRTLWDGIAPAGTEDLVVHGNELRDCWGGVYVKSVAPNPLTGVAVTGNTVTVVPGSDRPGVGVRAVPGAPVGRVTVRDNEVIGGRFSYDGEISFTEPPQTS
ncbi:hypothetical protein GCM10027168_73580 [Streptomyces capparidis]